MKIQRFIPASVILLYIFIIFVSPPSFINGPKFLFLTIARYPLYLTNKIFYELNYVIHSKDIIQDNMELRKTVELITHQLINYKETTAENERLKKILNFKQKSPYKLIVAKVIAKDSTNLSDTVLIDKGRNSGVDKDTVVITEAGLAGRVSSSSSNISRVVLITDPDSRVSACILRSRQLGVVYGISSKLCKLRYLSLDADVKIGDEVVTSGFSNIYPKGLAIGTVIKIDKEPTGISLFAIVKPAVELPKAEEVLCIE